jgi:hypothetical protein
MPSDLKVSMMSQILCGAEPMGPPSIALKTMAAKPSRMLYGIPGERKTMVKSDVVMYCCWEILLEIGRSCREYAGTVIATGKGASAARAFVPSRESTGNSRHRHCKISYESETDMLDDSCVGSKSNIAYWVSHRL